MMGLRMKAVCEHTPYLHNRKKYYCTRHSGVSDHSQESYRASKKIPLKKYRRSDPIHCLTVMKLARSVLAYV